MNQTVIKNARAERRTAFNLVCGISEHIISAGTALVLTPFLIAKLGIELYGLYPIVLELAAMLGVFYGIINSTSSRYVAVETERGNYENASKYFSSAFFANVALSGILLAPMAVAAIFANRFLEIPVSQSTNLRIFIILVFAATVTDALSSVFGSVYYITNRLDVRAGQQLAGTFTKAVALAVLFLFFEPTLISVGVAILASSASIAVFQIIAARKLEPSLSISFSNFSLTAVRQLSASGLWYSFNRAAAMLMGGAMLIVANLFFLPEASGSYSVAFVFTNALSGVILMLAAVFVPISTKCFARGERNRLRDSLIRDQRIVGCLASIAVSVAIAFCGDFFKLWLGEESNQTVVSVAVILLVPLLSLACATPVINVAMVMNRTRRLSLVFLGGGLASLALSLWVAGFSGLGAIGLAAVSCLAQTFWYSVAVPLFASKVFASSAKKFLTPVAKTYLSAAVSLGCCLLISYVCDVKSWFSLVIVCAVSAVVASVVSFFGVFNSFKFKI